MAVVPEMSTEAPKESAGPKKGEASNSACWVQLVPGVALLTAGRVVALAAGSARHTDAIRTRIAITMISSIKVNPAAGRRFIRSMNGSTAAPAET